MAKRTDEPTEDLTNRQYGKWTVKSYAGKLRAGGVNGCSSVTDQWNCVCACGHETVVQKFNLVNGRSTQCRRCAYDSRTSLVRKYSPMWFRLRKLLCTAWRTDYFAFEKWVDETRHGRTYLCRRNLSKPHSPENSYWSSLHQKADEFNEKLIHLRMRIKNETRAQAIEWSASISRQGRHNFYDRYKDVTQPTI